MNSDDDIVQRIVGNLNELVGLGAFVELHNIDKHVEDVIKNVKMVPISSLPISSLPISSLPNEVRNKILLLNSRNKTLKGMKSVFRMFRGDSPDGSDSAFCQREQVRYPGASPRCVTNWHWDPRTL